MTVLCLPLQQIIQANVYKEIGWMLSFVYFLVGWHDKAVILHLVGVIFAQLACPTIDDIFCLHRE